MFENFKYWVRHWYAFQVTAIKLKCWKPRFVLHDWYKPWLEMFLSEKTVRNIHRKYSSHHPENGGDDYLAMVIDWECARLTKPHMPLNARDTMLKYYPELQEKITPILNKLKL